jgi:hypothetical protein
MPIQDMGDTPDPLRFQGRGQASSNNVRHIHTESASGRTNARELGLDDGAYSLDDFYVASTNQHDHSETIQLKLPKHVKALVNQFVGMEDLPALRSANDVVRDALVHRLHYLQHEYGASDALRLWITMETTRTRLETIHAEMIAQRQLVEYVREVVDQAVESRDPAMLELIATSGTEFVRSAREPHRSSVLEHLRMGYTALGMDDSALQELAGEETADPFDPTVELHDAMHDAMRGEPHQ